MHPTVRATIPLLALLALPGCGMGDSANDEPGASSALDAPDRTLSLQVEPVYRVGGFDAPDWAAFGSVSAVRFDQEGNLYVLDGQTSQVTVVAPDGSFVRTVGKPGEGPGELSSAFSFVVLPTGEVAIFDLGHRGFVVYDVEGEYVRTVPVDMEEVGFPGQDLTYHPSGGAVSGIGGRIRMRMGPGGGELEPEPAGRPVAYYPLDEGGGRELYRAWELPEEPEEETQSLQMSGGGAFTMRMPVERAFEPGLNVGVLPDGRVVVADSIGYRLKLVDLDGEVTRVLARPVPGTPVTEAIRRQEKERRLAELSEGGGPRMMIAVRTPGGGGGQVDPAAVRRMQEERVESMTFADEIPVIEDIAVEPSGRIWVQRSSGVPGEPGPTDILTADGRYLGSLPPDGLRIPEAFGPDGLMVRIERDDLDVPTIIVERLPEEGDPSTDG